jgi:hydrogenase maturation protease
VTREADVTAARVLVVGFGNTLAADDGCGPAVVASLRDRPPAGLRLEDGHTDALRLAALWDGEVAIWLVDALLRGAAPGTVHRLGHRAVTGIPQRHATVHQLSLPECLRWLALTYPTMARVRYRLWGIEPERLSLGLALSPAVARSVLLVAQEIRAGALSLRLRDLRQRVA